MIAARPPMGWNTWNTFGLDISEELVCSVADAMAADGYLAAGYEYLVIDDGWAEKERDADGRLVPDRRKFPRGIQAVADYVHARGLKLGMYSCAGALTCAGYPGSYGHEFEDARQFARWGADYLKYDFCNFPENADCRNRYLRMGMALKASGRDILFAACNWGEQAPWGWMRSIGAHTYRSTPDIFDNFKSFTGIFFPQLEHLCQSGPGCFNDLDMLTVGMHGTGNAAIGRPCTDGEYRMQFSLWCLAGAPLFIGADIRSLDPESRGLLLHPGLIAADQDEECRPPVLVGRRPVTVPVEDSADAVRPLREEPDRLYTFVRHLSGNAFVMAFYNLFEEEAEMTCILADAGLPASSGLGFRMADLLTGEELGVRKEYVRVAVPGHDCRLFRCTLEAC